MDDVQVTIEGPVATVTLNRPRVKNAVNAEMWVTLRQIYSELGYDDAVRVVILTGAGGDFCSGADVSGIGSGERGEGRHGTQAMRQVNDSLLALHAIPKPTIAKVNGVAAGAGLNMALCCDLVVASDRSRFSEIFARRSLSIDYGGSWILPRLVGLHKAKELAFFADIIDADEALSIGLINKVVTEDELDAAVADWAARLAQGPPIALRLSKVLLNEGVDRTFPEALLAEGHSQTVNFATEDVVEAGRAWVEKRDPEFKGR